MAAGIAEEINREYMIPLRASNGVKIVHEGHAGFKMLHGLNSSSIIATLIEPCFANFDTDEARKIFEDEDRFAFSVACAVGKYFKTENII